MGACAPVTFEELLQGRSGLVPPGVWEIPDLPLRVGRVAEDAAAAVRALPGAWRPDRLDPVAHFALVAAHQAREDSGLSDPRDWEEAAVVLASAMGGEHTHYSASAQLAEHRVTGKRLRIS